MADQNGEKGDKLQQILEGLTTITTRLDAVEGAHKNDAEGFGKMLKDAMDSVAEGVRKHVSDCMDSVGKRLDALEAHRKDSETEEEKKAREKKERDDAEEKARKDAAEEQARKDREEATRKDAQETRIKDLEAQLAAITKHVSDTPTEDRARFAEVWNKAERLAQLHCDSQGAPKWAPGESLHAYTCRVFDKYKSHSAGWKDVDLTKLTDPAAFSLAITSIYNDAEAAATKPENVPGGEMRKIVDKSSGREIIRWVARNDDACWRQFTNVSFMVGKFRRPQPGAAA